VTASPIDVAVIGGGMAGISAALDARRRGARVVLFDPGPIGGT
jgi:glycine/D-amino acid oxidase-like deaminating enzyme